MTAAAHTPQPSYTAADALTFLAARVRDTISWTTDSIVDTVNEADSERIETELDQLGGLMETASALCTTSGSHDHYSDGRPIWTQVELSDGCFYSHLWHPDPAKDSQRSVEFPSKTGVRDRVHIIPPSILAIETIASLSAVPD